jgi:hypothetical protein
VQRLGWIGLLIWVLLASPAAADTSGTGSALLEDCQAQLRVVEGEDNWETLARGSSCLGLVRGVSLTLHFLKDDLPEHARVCLPGGSTPGQYIRIVVKYLEARPERLHLRDVDLIMSALEDAFPCQ